MPEVCSPPRTAGWHMGTTLGHILLVFKGNLSPHGLKLLISHPVWWLLMFPLLKVGLLASASPAFYSWLSQYFSAIWQRLVGFLVVDESPVELQGVCAIDGWDIGELEAVSGGEQQTSILLTCWHQWNAIVFHLVRRKRSETRAALCLAGIFHLILGSIGLRSPALFCSRCFSPFCPALWGTGHVVVQGARGVVVLGFLTCIIVVGADGFLPLWGSDKK